MATALSSGDKRNEVRISTQEGTFEAILFTSVGQRLQDMVNDERTFLPAEVEEHGKKIIKLINKKNIFSIVELAKIGV